MTTALLVSVMVHARPKTISIFANAVAPVRPGAVRMIIVVIINLAVPKVDYYQSDQSFSLPTVNGGATNWDEHRLLHSSAHHVNPAINLQRGSLLLPVVCPRRGGGSLRRVGALVYDRLDLRALQ